MSTIILGVLSRPAAPGDAGLVDGAGDDKKRWAEALAAVIPGEALAAYTAMIAFFTVKGTGTEASLSHPTAVRWTSGVILVAIPVLYATTAGKFFTIPDFVRWGMAIVAFGAWLWLLPLSVWDTVKWVKNLDAAVRGGVGVTAAFAVVVLANFLFKRFPVPPSPPASPAP